MQLYSTLRKDVGIEGNCACSRVNKWKKPNEDIAHAGHIPMRNFEKLELL